MATCVGNGWQLGVCPRLRLEAGEGRWMTSVAGLRNWRSRTVAIKFLHSHAHIANIREEAAPKTHRAAGCSLRFIPALFSISVLCHEQWGYAAAFQTGLNKAFFPLMPRQLHSTRQEREFQPPEPKGEAEGIPWLLTSGICDGAKLQTAGTITPSWFLDCIPFLTSKSSSLKPKSFSVGWMVNICHLGT